MEAQPAVTTRPSIIAHRGFSGRYPENTLASVRAALDLGVDFVEIDVQETADGELIVFHDFGLRRLCGVRGRVRDRTLAEIRRLNPQVPTMRQVLQMCRGKTRVLIEIKHADPHAVAAEISETRMESEVIVFSLSIRRMKEIALLNQRISRFGLVARRLPLAMARLKAVGIEGVGLSRRLVRSQRVVRRIHKRGWKLFVWTVNREAEMKRLSGWGVDGLITNHPDVAKSCLARL
ncbi:MAG: glycerophosphodiester phosphodiesterase [Verrucomicrobiia bacterium]|jgi:glycerophosphoryl diester phosphodiesterase